MKKQYYIDGFQQVHFAGGMVRIDTFVLAPRPNAEPEMEVSGQLIMAPQAIAGALDAMLAEVGMLQTQAPDPRRGGNA